MNVDVAKNVLICSSHSSGMYVVQKQTSRYMKVSNFVLTNFLPNWPKIVDLLLKLSCKISNVGDKPSDSIDKNRH